MAFPAHPIRTPVAIGDLIIELQQPTPNGGGQPRTFYTVQVIYNDGTRQTLTGDLQPHLTTAQINNLLAFMASMRTKAESEILPAP